MQDSQMHSTSDRHSYAFSNPTTWTDNLAPLFRSMSTFCITQKNSHVWRVPLRFLPTFSMSHLPVDCTPPPPVHVMLLNWASFKPHTIPLLMCLFLKIIIIIVIIINLPIFYRVISKHKSSPGCFTWKKTRNINLKLSSKGTAIERRLKFSLECF